MQFNYNIYATFDTVWEVLMKWGLHFEKGRNYIIATPAAEFPPLLCHHPDPFPRMLLATPAANFMEL
jgi:hypothetical protein